MESCRRESSIEGAKEDAARDRKHWQLPKRFGQCFCHCAPVLSMDKRILKLPQSHSGLCDDPKFS